MKIGRHFETKKIVRAFDTTMKNHIQTPTTNHTNGFYIRVTGKRLGQSLTLAQNHICILKTSKQLQYSI